MYTKAKIFNLALGALLLQRRIVEAETDPSNEAKVLLTHYDTAFRAALQDMDLDSTSSQKDLEKIEDEPNDLWLFSYKYPNDCVFLRRIQSTVDTDSRATHIPKRVAMKDGVKVIFCNLEEAIAEYISKDVPLHSLSANAGLAIAYKLAILAAPLVTGKGAKSLIEAIEKKYAVAKAEAKSHDRNENLNFEEESTISEFVHARTT